MKSARCLRSPHAVDRVWPYRPRSQTLSRMAKRQPSVDPARPNEFIAQGTSDYRRIEAIILDLAGRLTQTDQQ